ncbi:ATP/maltotriose-dependent transcriptional regulator MalT [Rhodococcus rhodochrous J45]|uniref:ATP/maltotriose-dependent transcriptional regulator MalT n=1 Tax=Rhodococcus rhodochrous J45 TaxID=935266 RepID=A0A562E1K9_RHORH|nr:LuxR C-terminal-related transcriptional regulator [Rhodococcus rhodochrous]TWH15806.1 ATP/maltotriose-dependent transcriptional regulator MalT [Rhodococcus rhodochrous J45]
MTDPEPCRVIAYVGPSTADSAADRYWTRIFDSVRRCIDIDASRTSRGFAALRTALSTADTPVTLVLDGTRLDEDVAEGIGTLLADEPTLRIVVATRTTSSAGAGMPSDTRILTSADLAFTVDETTAYLRDAGVPQERWVVERIVHRTGGLPAVIGRLPTALSSAPIPGATELEHLDRIVDAVIDSVTARTIKNEPLLAHLLRPVLMSAMTDSLTCASLAESGVDAPTFVTTLESLGLVESVPGSPARAYPDAVRRSLLRRAVADLPAEPTRTYLVVPGAVDRGSDSAALLGQVVALRKEGRFAEAASICDDLASRAVSSSGTPETTVVSDAAFCFQAGLTYFFAVRPHEAMGMLRRARSAGAGTPVGEDAAAVLGLMHALRGEGPEARAALSTDRSPRRHHRNNARLAHTAEQIAAALLAIDRLESDVALDILVDIEASTAPNELWALTLYAQGSLALLTHTPMDGLRRIKAEIRKHPELHAGYNAVLVNAIRADLELALGDFDRARNLVADSTHLFTAPVHARMRLLTGDPAGSEALVHHYGTDPNCTPRQAMELAVLGAAAACALGRDTEARPHLDRAIALSQQTGLLRPFTMVSPLMARHLGSLGVDLPTAAEPTALDTATYPKSKPVVRLTPRERAVLDGLIAGRSARTIAKVEFVSVNTVKTQLRSLYRKLGVNSGKDAVIAARHLMLD